MCLSIGSFHYPKWVGYQVFWPTLQILLIKYCQRIRQKTKGICTKYLWDIISFNYRQSVKVSDYVIFKRFIFKMTGLTHHCLQPSPRLPWIFNSIPHCCQRVSSPEFDSLPRKSRFESVLRSF